MKKLNLKNALSLYGKEYIKIVIRELRSSNKVASGNLIKSFTSDVVDIADELSLEMWGADYAKFVDKGRRKGTYPPIQPLLSWVKLKNLKPSAAYAIQKSIYKFGIKPTNFIMNAYDMSLNRLIKMTSEGYSKDMDEYLNSLNQEINKK
jgi:hypothetical protein